MFAAEIAFRGLHPYVTPQELNLVKLPATGVTQLRARPPLVMRGNVVQTCSLAATPDHVPHTFWQIPVPQTFPLLLTARKTRPPVMPAAEIQRSKAYFTHCGNGTVRIRPPLPIKSTIAQNGPLEFGPRRCLDRPVPICAGRTPITWPAWRSPSWPRVLLRERGLIFPSSGPDSASFQSETRVASHHLPCQIYPANACG